MRKCKHDVMIPSDIEGDESPYCSGCRSSPHMVKLQEFETEKDADERDTVCPICCSVEFNYVSEEEYDCPNCGFTVGDII